MHKGFEMLDAISELVYVSDIETYELLYLNQPGLDIFGLERVNGEKCYELLQNRSSPCEFCTNDKLSAHETYTWEYYNPTVNGYFILKDRLIDWEGKKARFEVAFEITKLEEQKKDLRQVVEIEQLIIECVKILHQIGSIERTVNNLLEKIGNFLGAERTYIFEIEGDRMHNTYEWCTAGVHPEKENLQNMDTSLLDRWKPAFLQQQCVIIDDLEDIRETSAEEYRVLKKQNIQSLVTAPLISEGRLVGYIGVDNPSQENIQHVPLIFTTLSYFLVSIIEKQVSEESLRQLSYQDTLTRVHNRNRFTLDMEALEKDIVSNIGVVYVDLNGLKAINDNQGHNYGDLALTNTVTKIAAIFPRKDIYRVGGDEFVVIANPIDEDEFNMRVWDLKKSFINNLEYDAAIGSQWSALCESVQVLVSLADEQMYADKKAYYRKNPQTGRYRSINDQFLELVDPDTFRKLLEDKDFPIYLQPKMSFSDRQLIGAEALVRYFDKNHVLYPPDAFIPILESSRLIHMLDFYVFHSVCEIIQSWIKEGRQSMPVSVNMSRYTLTHPDFLENLLEIWNRFDLPQEMVQIEITEGSEQELSSEIVEILQGVKNAGFVISIDDFGVKYANLSLFTSMDFDVLKIDKSLLDNIQKNEKAQLLVRTIAGLCRKLGIFLVAEGVETEEQFEMLHTLSCDAAQGYLFSKPIPLDEFTETYLAGADTL